MNTGCILITCKPHLLNTKHYILGHWTWWRRLLGCLVACSGCQCGRWLGLLARQLSVRCASTVSSGTWSALSSNNSHGRDGNKDGGDHDPHRPVGDEHRRRAHCQDRRRAVRANFEGTVADVDLKPLTSWTHLRRVRPTMESQSSCPTSDSWTGTW